MSNIPTEQREALCDALSMLVDDQSYYLENSDIKADYDDLAEVAERRSNMWRNIAELLESMQCASGEINQCLSIAQEWEVMPSRLAAAEEDPDAVS